MTGGFGYEYTTINPMASGLLEYARRQPRITLDRLRDFQRSNLLDNIPADIELLLRFADENGVEKLKKSPVRIYDELDGMIEDFPRVLSVWKDRIWLEEQNHGKAV